jgi:hypothetical protein
MKIFAVITAVVLCVSSAAASERVCVEIGPAKDLFCAVNGDNGPNWMVMTGCEDILTIAPPETGRTILSLSASASGRYIAILSANEGHPVLGVYNAANLDAAETPVKIKDFNPYPGVIGQHQWEDEQLLFTSDATFSSGTELATEQRPYRYNPKSGEIYRKP